MKKILLLLLFPFACFSQTEIINSTGTPYIHNQSKGGVGADKIILLPIGDHTTIFGALRLEGRIQINNSTMKPEFNNGIGWNYFASESFVNSGLSNKLTIPSGTSFQVLDGLGVPKTLPSYLTSETDPVWISEKPNYRTKILNDALYVSSSANLKIPKPVSGVTNSSGNYSYTFPIAYSVAPNIQAQLIGGTDLTFFRITSVTTTGFNIYAFSRSSITSLPIVGTLTGALLGSAGTPLNGATIDVLITEK